jgi:uncharacterized protein YbaP (TraB family)
MPNERFSHRFYFYLCLALIGTAFCQTANAATAFLGGEIRLLDYRNLRWMKRIEAEIAGGQPTAIVVGTAHFVGPNNVIELLEKRGHKIEQL